ncbi:MAG: hypothetical protein ACK2T7_15260 [Anaerolineales bacterium]
MKITARQAWIAAGTALLLAGLSLLMAWVSNGARSMAGWQSFLITGAAGLAFCWAWALVVRKEAPPRWLIWLVAGAIVLRLAVGIFWVAALPVWGNPNEVQQAGYVMFDPYLRDGAAWELAQSGEPLLSAFGGYSAHDQYGGLLFLSALTYRLLGGEVHQPLLMVMLTGMASGMAVLFVWAFIRRLWGEPGARIAAWGLALYPEAVLLGSSQMREAFTIPLSAALAYLLVRYIQEREKKDLLLMAFMALITASFTWTFLLQLAAILGLLLAGILIAGREKRPLPRWLAIVLAGLGVIILLAGGFLWGRLSSMNDFQSYLTAHSSGVVQAVTRRLPGILGVPFIVAYGVVRPLLPAALTELGPAEFWRWVAIWRSLGWTILLTMLVYATLMVIRKRQWLQPAGMLAWGSWVMILVASFRAGGDMWDNPRYRASFVIFQAALAIWAWLQHQEGREPLLRRLVVMVGLMEVVITFWYAARYSDSGGLAGRVETRVAIGLGVGVLYWLLDWLWERRKKREGQFS